MAATADDPLLQKTLTRIEPQRGAPAIRQIFPLAYLPTFLSCDPLQPVMTHR
jgi:hypothetical protein